MNNNREHIHHLKSIRDAIRPRASWVSDNRRQLMRSIVQSGAASVERRETDSFVHRIIGMVHVFVSGSTLRTIKPAFTVFMAVVIATSGWIASVHASFDSVPGDVLWSVKLATENTQLAMANLTGSQADAAQLNLKFAHRRAKEFKQVIETGATHSKENATTAIEHLKSSLESADKSLHEVGQSNPENALNLAKEVHQATQEISQTLKEGTDLVVDATLAKEVVETKKVATDVSLNAVVVVLTNANASSTGISSEEIKAMVQDKVNGLIADVASDVQAAKKLTEQIQQIGSLGIGTTTGTPSGVTSTGKNDAVKTLAVSSTQIVILSSTPQLGATVSSTQGIGATAQQVEAVVKKAGENVQTVQTNAQQIQTLLNSQQLLEAVQKTIELNSAIREVKDVVVPVVPSSTPSIK